MLKQYGQWLCNVTIQGKTYEGREIVLPLPPSVNEKVEPNFQAIKAWAMGIYSNSKKLSKGLLKNTTVYNQWLNAARQLLRKGLYPMYEEEVAVFITFVFPNNRSDADNPVKALFDAFTLSEHLIKDDKQIYTFTVTKVVIPKESFVVAFVVPRKDLGNLGFEISQSYLEKKIQQVTEEN